MKDKNLKKRIIHYVAQPKNSRECGAASMSMILKTHGIASKPKKIWQSLQSINAQGLLFMKTHSYAKYLQERKFKVAIIRAKDPIYVLELAFERGVDATLVCRPNSHQDVGHFMVLVSIDAQSVTVHDPSDQPSRIISRKELAGFFVPLTQYSEITERILVLSSPKDLIDSKCETCNQSFPIGKVIKCVCGNDIHLPFPAILGCLNSGCAGSNFEAIICPTCDSELTNQGLNSGGEAS